MDEEEFNEISNLIDGGYLSEKGEPLKCTKCHGSCTSGTSDDNHSGDNHSHDLFDSVDKSILDKIRDEVENI